MGQQAACGRRELYLSTAPGMTAYLASSARILQPHPVLSRHTHQEASSYIDRGRRHVGGLGIYQYRLEVYLRYRRLLYQEYKTRFFRPLSYPKAIFYACRPPLAPKGLLCELRRVNDVHPVGPGPRRPTACQRLIWANMRVSEKSKGGPILGPCMRDPTMLGPY